MSISILILYSFQTCFRASIIVELQTVLISIFQEILKYFLNAISIVINATGSIESNG